MYHSPVSNLRSLRQANSWSVESQVHRDVKPENVLLQPSGHIILTDFGCAKEYREFSSEDDTMESCESGAAGLRLPRALSARS